MNVLCAASPVADDVGDLIRDCRNALETRFAGLDAVLVGAPRNARGWFDLLAGFPEAAAHVAVLARMKAALAADSARWPPCAVEQFALLQAFSAAAGLLPELPVEVSVKRLFCALGRQVAAPPADWEPQFDLAGGPFMEIAKLASLQRFPAGQLVFNFITLPRSWLLKVHPLDLPATLGEIVFGLGGFGPFAAPHLNHWRANPLLLLPTENERSLWRIAKSIELQPRVRGLMADGWFYSPQVGTLFPHLAWLRAFFVDNGGHIVDLEAAAPGSGFMVGSAKRRKLYERGAYQPRRTLVLWRREHMLAWAASRPELGEDGDPPARRPRRAASVPATAGRRRRKPLFDAVPFLNRHPKVYVLATLVLPSLAASIAAGVLLSAWAALPALAATFVAMWLVQYFLFQ